MNQLSKLKWDNYKDAKMELFGDHWSTRAAHAAGVFKCKVDEANAV